MYPCFSLFFLQITALLPVLVVANLYSAGTHPDELPILGCIGENLENNFELKKQWGNKNENVSASKRQILQFAIGYLLLCDPD